MKKEPSNKFPYFINRRLFLQLAANKFKESQNMLRMAHRMDAVSAQLRANISNTDVTRDNLK